MTNQASRNSMIEVLRFLGSAETFLRRGDDNLQLRYLFLFNTLGSVKKQKRKRNSHRAWHGLIPLSFQEVDMVTFLIGTTPSKNNLLQEQHPL